METSAKHLYKMLTIMAILIILFMLTDNRIFAETISDNTVSKNKTESTEPDTPDTISKNHTKRATSVNTVSHNTISQYDMENAESFRETGVVHGPSGKETWYNLPMDRILEIMADKGYSEETGYAYWEREDGAKMLGDYVMVAANLSERPRGTIIDTSMGKGIVVDTGEFAQTDKTALDIAVTW